MDLRVGRHYQLVKKIGNGAFGEIYEGKKNWFYIYFASQRETPLFKQSEFTLTVQF